MKANIFKLEHWYDRRYDGRRKEFKGITRKEFKGITREEFKKAVQRHYAHAYNKLKVPDIYAERRRIIAYFANIPYKYEGDGLDDFNLYQRPASNGRGYVAICPGESGNNFYTEDLLTVSYLKSKYEKQAI